MDFPRQKCSVVFMEISDLQISLRNNIEQKAEMSQAKNSTQESAEI